MAELPNHSASTQILAFKESISSSEEIDEWGTNRNGLLASIYEAVGLMLPSIKTFSSAMTALEEIADSMAEQQCLLKEALAVRDNECLRPSAPHNCEQIESVRHSVLKHDLHFLSVSRSYSRLFEFSQSEFEKLSFTELVHPLDRARLRKYLTPLLRGKVSSCELVEWRATGSHGFVLSKDTMWAIGATQAGGPRYIASVSERVTEQEVAAVLSDRANHSVEMAAEDEATRYARRGYQKFRKRRKV
jgi:PAS domain-containing protein